jgi:hypothetical protein
LFVVELEDEFEKYEYSFDFVHVLGGSLAEVVSYQIYQLVKH